ncbi:hypothetical protein MHU86_7356 [Fragilaria crotonensis]|nr:hypothetical protein MHU86_7356 [Fragilaria crotonensis]
MGGVWFDNLDPHAAPILWRHRFPPHVASALITAANPTGHLSISDLELAGIIAHRAIVAHARDVAERTIWVNADNRAAVSWTTKGSSTSAAARAHLLRFAALHQRAYRYVVRTHYIPGPVNVMADDASRRWDLDDAALLTFFNTRYPQVQSWRMQTLTPAISASLIGSLSKPRSRAASPPNGMPPPQPLGPSGRPSVPAWASIPSNLDPTQFLFSNSLPTATTMAPSLPAVTPSGLGRWKTPYARWVRRMPAWGPWTLV